MSDVLLKRKGSRQSYTNLLRIEKVWWSVLSLQGAISSRTFEYGVHSTHRSLGNISTIVRKNQYRLTIGWESTWPTTRKQNGVVELQSLNFPKRAQFFVNAVQDEKQGDWADHLRGAAKMLGEKYRLKVGLSGIIEGSLPIGGLSSSASVIICFLSALCKVNGIHLKPMEMILTAKAAENQYVGVSCGKLDQSCEVLSRKTIYCTSTRKMTAMNPVLPARRWSPTRLQFSSLVWNVLWKTLSTICGKMSARQRPMHWWAMRDGLRYLCKHPAPWCTVWGLWSL